MFQFGNSYLVFYCLKEHLRCFLHFN